MYHYYALAILVHLALAHQHHDYPKPGQHPTLVTSDRVQGRWLQKYGKQFDLPFSGPLSFGHIPYQRCLENESALFDIAILGLPFDTSVTYRPGARFGPYAIRSGSRRLSATRSHSLAWMHDPLAQGLHILDCGDVPITPFDNYFAIEQIEVAYSTLLARAPPSDCHYTSPLANDGEEHPRIVSLGGDHTIVLPILRSLHAIYGPISIIHFDAHLDTWTPYTQTGETTPVTHGNFFTLAYAEGLMSNTSVHAGIRCKVAGISDIDHDQAVGFELISTDDLDDVGIPEIIRRIRARVGDSATYLSLDIDVLDPAFAPATGTPEAGGWTMREVKRILRGLKGLNVVGADVVEVAPAYDHADITGIAAADLVHDLLSLFTAPPAT